MADNGDTLAQFMSITGASPDTATQYLELTNWSLSEAVNLFMESGGQGVGGDAAMPPAAPSGGSYEDDVRAPDPSKRQRLFGDGGFDSMPIRRLHEQYRDFAAESIAAINASSSNASAISSAFGAGADGSEERTRDLTSLFQPPVNLMFKGTYSEARAAAKSQNKWLLVNIQDEIVFASHMLNRDTWANDIVENVVASGYIFWQHYWVSDHGKKFCSLYQIDRDHLPIIAIVNPKTGVIEQKWSGFIEAQEMTERLSDFAFSQTFDTDDAAPGEDKKVSFKRDITEASEEDQLAAAIAASMEGAGSEQSQESDAEHDDEEEKAAEPTVEAVLEPMPTEPAEGTPDVTRVQIRAPDGARLTRRFLKSDPISLLWRFVKEQIPEARTRAFELRTTFPPKAIELSESTIAESKLENASLMVKWP